MNVSINCRNKKFALCWSRKTPPLPLTLQRLCHGAQGPKKPLARLLLGQFFAHSGKLLLDSGKQLLHAVVDALLAPPF